MSQEPQPDAVQADKYSRSDIKQGKLMKKDEILPNGNVQAVPHYHGSNGYCSRGGCMEKADEVKCAIHNKTTCPCFGVSLLHKRIAEQQAKIDELEISNATKDAMIESANEMYKRNLEESRLQIQAHKKAIKKIIEYVGCDYECASAGWEAGEPTPDGGYRTKIKGKWYQSRPIDERPKCDCGAQTALQSAAELGDK